MSSTSVPVGTRAARTGDPPVQRPPAWRGYLPVLVVAAILAVAPLLIADSRYFMGLASLGLVSAAYAVGFNIIFGDTNQLFLCQGALAGVGAYGSGILGNELEWPMWLGILVGMAVAGLLGAAFSWVSVRRRLDVIFVGIVTLAFSLVFINLLLGQRDLTGGETGLVILSDPGIVGDRGLGAYYVFLVVLVLFLTVHRALQRSHVGWAFRALRDDELAAELSGVNVARFKILAGVVGSMMIALVGGLYAHYEGIVSPTTFELGQLDVPVLVTLAFGGIGSLTGPVVGAAVFTVVDELLRELSQLRTAVYGLILLALFLGFRRGVVPMATDLVNRLQARRGSSRIG
jgi:ABC-type branched-subunit amino acid transport system permease subunit